MITNSTTQNGIQKHHQMQNRFTRLSQVDDKVQRVEQANLLYKNQVTFQTALHCTKYF